ncbi:MAG: DUF4230 domain-containing protein [Saprospiraceae bacterium]|nr:DUF4230 domain-containing protein [Saprospiraceae bacterium]
MKKILWPVSVILAFCLGLYMMTGNWLPWAKTHTSHRATTILEQIEKVTKLITVEGHFAEIYNYKDYYGYDWSIFRKKALIRVQAKVSAGFDLGKMNIEANSSMKEIILSNLPEPTILSIDHDLDYYDLTEGTFNTFTRDDLNKLNDQAKKYIEEVALRSDLLKQAEIKGKDMIETIRFLVEANGWQLVVRQNDVTKAGD